MDITLTLKNFENSLRDLINAILSKSKGENWFDNCGLSDNRIQSWRDSKKREQKRIKNSDERLIYYSQFFDLKEIVKKNWEVEFCNIFKNKIEFEILFDILEQYRNPEAHRRELLPFQNYLILGISGKFRTEITKYFSKMETGESYYPRLEHIQDNLNNNWARNKSKVLNTHKVLRVGDKLEFTLTATDPMGEEILLTALPIINPLKCEWKTSNNFELEIKKCHVGEVLYIKFAVKSNREFHAKISPGLGHIDDEVIFTYEVLPPK